MKMVVCAVLYVSSMQQNHLALHKANSMQRYKPAAVLAALVQRTKQFCIWSKHYCSLHVLEN